MKQQIECDTPHITWRFIIGLSLGAMVFGMLVMYATQVDVPVRVERTYVENASVICQCTTFGNAYSYGYKVSPETCASTGGDVMNCELRDGGVPDVD